MHFQYIPYIWPLMSSALVSLSLGIYSLLRQRNSKGAKSFILSMFVVTIWSSGNAMEMASTDVCGKIPELARACIDRSITHSEFSINMSGVSKAYEVLLSPLTDSKGMLIGRLAVTYDITEKKQAQQEHLKQQWNRAPRRRMNTNPSLSSTTISALT